MVNRERKRGRASTVRSRAPKEGGGGRREWTRHAKKSKQARIGGRENGVDAYSLSLSLFSCGGGEFGVGDLERGPPLFGVGEIEGFPLATASPTCNFFISKKFFFRKGGERKLTT